MVWQLALKNPVCETVVWPLTSGCKIWKKKRSDRPRLATGVKKKPGLTDRCVATGVTKFRMASDGLKSENLDKEMFVHWCHEKVVETGQL